jgi:hypothetical protein
MNFLARKQITRQGIAGSIAREKLTPKIVKKKLEILFPSQAPTDCWLESDSVILPGNLSEQEFPQNAKVNLVITSYYLFGRNIFTTKKAVKASS